MPWLTLGGASLARPRRSTRGLQALTCGLGRGAHLAGLHERTKLWHGAAGAACPAHRPARVRNLLELQELNPPAPPVSCAEDRWVIPMGAKPERDLRQGLAARCTRADAWPVRRDAGAGPGSQRRSHGEQEGV